MAAHLTSHWALDPLARTVQVISFNGEKGERRVIEDSAPVTSDVLSGFSSSAQEFFRDLD